MNLSKEEEEAFILQNRRKVVAHQITNFVVMETTQVMADFSAYDHNLTEQGDESDYSFSGFTNWWENIDKSSYPNIVKSTIPLRSVYEVISNMDTMATEFGDTIRDTVADSLPEDSLSSPVDTVLKRNWN